MHKYKTLALSYLDDRLVPEGAEIDYDGNPGTNLEPLDDAAREKQAAYFRSKGITPAQADQFKRVLTHGEFDNGALGASGPPAPSVPAPTAPPVHHVTIPSDWATMDAEKMVALAARLGAPVEMSTRAAAQAFIKAEVDRRMGRRAAA